MAKWTYDDSLNRLLQHEGGYTNHPADPGGPTNFGITISDYRKYVKPGATATDVQAMKIDEAKAIYRAKYWDAQRCDELPAGVDYAVFDYGVNSGIGRSKKVLQRILGVAADGSIGPETMRAARSADPEKIVNAICDERLRFLQGLRTWPTFGRGWGRRVADVRAVSLGFARRTPAPATPNVTAQGKAPPQAAGAPAKTSGGAAAAGAAVAAGASAGLPWWAIALIALVLGIAVFFLIHYLSKKD